MLVRVLEVVKFDGRRHSPGSVLEVPDQAAVRWLRMGQVEYVEAEVEPEAPDTDLVAELIEQVDGLSSNAAKALVGAGYTSLDKFAGVDLDLLTEINGVAEGTVNAIKVALEPEDGTKSESDDE